MYQVFADDLSEVPSLSRHPTVANYFTGELAVLKEVAQALADLFGLTLPVACKEQAHRMARGQVNV